MRFLIDAQLSPTLAKALAEAGHDAEHVADVGLLAATDDAIWAYAAANSAVIVTKDEDFTAKHRHDASVRVVWLRLGNSSKRELRDWFLPLLPSVEALLSAGETLIEIR